MAFGLRLAHHSFILFIYFFTLLCGTRSLTAMESCAGLSADHQLPGVPKAKNVLLNKLIHNHSIGPPDCFPVTELHIMPGQSPTHRQTITPNGQ
jgi:hypothetical protein